MGAGPDRAVWWMRGDVWNAGFRVLDAWGDPLRQAPPDGSLAPAGSAIRHISGRLSSLRKQQDEESIVVRGVARRDGRFIQSSTQLRRLAPPRADPVLLEPACGRLSCACSTAFACHPGRRMAAIRDPVDVNAGSRLVACALSGMTIGTRNPRGRPKRTPVSR